jgi:hypothetical protein
MRGLMILTLVLGTAACSSTPPTTQVAQTCLTAADGTQACQPVAPVSYQKSSQRYTAR